MGSNTIWLPQVDEYTTKINEMKELFRKKSHDFYFVQEGMKKINEFQKRKAEMEQELGDVSTTNTVMSVSYSERSVVLSGR